MFGTIVANVALLDSQVPSYLRYETSQLSKEKELIPSGLPNFDNACKHVCVLQHVSTNINALPYKKQCTAAKFSV